ncbi:DUF192 domain-containing protein [Candidatus Saccharibacteria bacterium]|nr:MAG: DUF192 domain-containing protein [Candidatus Saccharibacteria bacterium]
MLEEWRDAMLSVCNRFVTESCNVTDLQFSSGHTLEVRVAVTLAQKMHGLAASTIVDMGMLFVYDTPTFAPFTMEETLVDLDIGHYDSAGCLLQFGSYLAGSSEPVTCPYAFSYVVETEAGALPQGDFRFAYA